MYNIDINEIANSMISAEIWDYDDCMDLCEAAGMLDDFMVADGDSFESVVLEAAERLGVEII